MRTSIVRILALALSAIVGCIAVSLEQGLGTDASAPPPVQADDESEPDRPNIIWFIVEDMSPDLGVYGNDVVQTPHLDRFARTGTRFTRAFAVHPQCSPNRSALATGMYATTIGAQHHRSHRTDDYTLPQGVRVISDWLRAAGYFTGNIREMPADIGWEGSGKNDWNFQYEGRADSDAPFDTHTWDELVDQEPFFAKVQLSETHRPFDAPPRVDPSEVDLPPYLPDDPRIREQRAKYLDEVELADDRFGQFLRLLKQEGLAENTIVFFVSDHGRPFVRAKTWPYDAGLHIPLLVRWPEALEPPTHYESGKVDDRLVNAIDVTATTLWSAGVSPPMLMQGRVFFGPRADRLERSFVFGTRDRSEETKYRQRTVRSPHYRYVKNWHPERPFLLANEYTERTHAAPHVLREYYFQDRLTDVQRQLLAPDRPEEELYYIPDDPHQVHNLVDSNDPSHQAALQRLRGALQSFVDIANDQGRFPEVPGGLDHDDRPWTAFPENDWDAFLEWAEKHPQKYDLIKKMRDEWQRLEEHQKNKKR